MRCLVLLFAASIITLAFGFLIRYIADRVWDILTRAAGESRGRVIKQSQMKNWILELEVTVARAAATLQTAEQEYYNVCANMSCGQQQAVVDSIDMLGTGVTYICRDMMSFHTQILAGIRHIFAQRAMGCTYKDVESSVAEANSELRDRLGDLKMIIAGVGAFQS